MKLRYTPLPPFFYKSNRERLLQALDQDGLAVVFSNDLMPRNGDCHFNFRQNSDLLYLTGIDQEETLLLICPSEREEKKFQLFIKKTNAHIRVWDGEKLTKDEATQLSGIASIHWVDSFETVFQQQVQRRGKLYYSNNANDRAVSKVISAADRFLQQNSNLLKGKKLIPLGPLIADMRVIKHEVEIDQIRKAVEITALAFRRVLKFTRPARKEYEVEAEITHEFISKGSAGHAYQPIIAGGKNSCILHYIDNSDLLEEGDVLLLDFGAEYGNYAADLSRTIPVSGKFSPRQRAVYDAVLRVFTVAKTKMQVGALLKDVQAETLKAMKEELIQLGLLDKRASNLNESVRKYFMHGVAHFLGMDVHDVGNRNLTFKAGMVLTCEPGIYIPEERIGIRLENDILITTEGPVDLMESIPITPDQIEMLMA